MKGLNILKQGVKGKSVISEKIGYIEVYSDNDRLLSIDNFVASGIAYRQRDKPIITIFDGKNSPNEQVIFEGTFESLIDLIKNKK